MRAASSGLLVCVVLGHDCIETTARPAVGYSLRAGRAQSWRATLSIFAVCERGDRRLGSAASAAAGEDSLRPDSSLKDVFVEVVAAVFGAAFKDRATRGCILDLRQVLIRQRSLADVC